MRFSEAMQLLEIRQRVRRAEWPAGRFIARFTFAVQEPDFHAGSRAYFLANPSMGEIAPYIPTAADMAAMDWTSA